MLAKINIKKFSSKISLAVIGSGPGGMYSAKQLLRKHSNLYIDFFERFPYPFGLIRTGVAPDHQSTKNCIKDFSQILSNPNVKLFGNVNVGDDFPINLDVLKSNYSAILLAYGAHGDILLNLPNENCKGCYNSRTFVNWYNSGYDSIKNQDVKLNHTNTCVIIGNGNVALDITRMLSKNYDDLKSFDMNNEVLLHLTKNTIENIHIVARRGVYQSAFSNLEMKELLKVPDINMYVLEDEFKQSMESDVDYNNKMLSEGSPSFKNQIKSKLKIFEEKIKVVKNISEVKPARKNVFLRYLKNPKEIISDKDNQLTGIVFNKTILENGKIKVLDELDSISCGLLFKSLGYKAKSIFSELDFDRKNSVISQINGQVKSKGVLSENIFSVGWLKTGAQGIIASTLEDTRKITSTIDSQIEKKLILEKSPNYAELTKLMEKNENKIITFEDWLKLDKYELEQGVKNGKLREKFINVNNVIEYLNKV